MGYGSTHEDPSRHRSGRRWRLIYGRLQWFSADDLEDTEVGDWMMSDFRSACAYATSQGWLIIGDDGLTLTTARLAAARR